MVYTTGGGSSGGGGQPVARANPAPSTITVAGMTFDRKTVKTVAQVAVGAGIVAISAGACGPGAILCGMALGAATEVLTTILVNFIFGDATDPMELLTAAIAGALGGGISAALAPLIKSAFGSLAAKFGKNLAAKTEGVPSSGIRFSQSSVNGAAEIEASMRANGWVGDAIDVVRMRDGGLTSVDNTRLLAAKRAKIDAQANVHAFDDALPAGMVERFTTVKGGVPSTWGDAVMNRIGRQNAGYREANPFGSWVTGWSGN